MHSLERQSLAKAAAHMTMAEAEKIEYMLMAGKITRVEPVSWPETKEEIQKVLEHFTN